MVIEHLQDSSGKIVQITSQKQKMHLHKDGKGWVLEDQSEEKTEEIPPTPKFINTTLALLVEDFAPGYL